MSDSRAAVTAMLTLASLNPPNDEIDYLVNAHVAIATGVQLLYGAAFGDADPLLTPTTAMEALQP